MPSCTFGSFDASITALPETPSNPEQVAELQGKVRKKVKVKEDADEDDMEEDSLEGEEEEGEEGSLEGEEEEEEDVGPSRKRAKVEACEVRVITSRLYDLDNVPI